MKLTMLFVCTGSKPPGPPGSQHWHACQCCGRKIPPEDVEWNIHDSTPFHRSLNCRQRYQDRLRNEFGF